MKKLLASVLGALLTLQPIAASADPMWLITPDEVARDAGWVAENASRRTVLRARAFSAGTPDIALVSPASVAEPISAPFPIQLSFKAKDGAIIKPDSFRVLYGFLKLDITERVAGRAKVRPDGVYVESASIPSGNHRLILQVSDDRDRHGETELRFSVK